MTADENMSPVFRTPEEVAPELGMTKTELRRYCRESDIHTRLSKNRIMLHVDDIPKLVAWVRDRQTASNDWTAGPDTDPFAKTPCKHGPSCTETPR